jgi:hypothetical protein
MHALNPEWRRTACAAAGFVALAACYACITANVPSFVDLVDKTNRDTQLPLERIATGEFSPFSAREPPEPAQRANTKGTGI